MIMTRILVVIIVVLVLSTFSHADTILVGSDGSNYADSDCWTHPAETLENCNWKASRYQAKNTGTISYFRVRSGITPTGCTNDSGCWAIYEGGTNSSLGALKAWTCFSGYDWTTIGAGWHDFSVENIETTATITAGQYYWIVFHSYAIDSTHYASAGCSAYIPAYRGQNDAGCISTAGLDASSGSAGRVETQCSYASVPAPSAFDSTVQTYVMWGVWEAEATGPSISTAPSMTHGSTITITGTGFGNKDPAAPLIWDDGEGATIGSTSAVTGAGSSAERADSETGWDAAGPQAAGDSTYNIQYRTSWNGMAQPHARSTTYLAAGHYDEGALNDQTDIYLTYNAGPVSNKWFMTYYLRLDPEWEDITATGPNYKEMRIGELDCVNSDHCSRYWAHASDPYSVFNGTSLVQINPNSYWCGLESEAAMNARGIHNLRVPNPVTAWRHREVRLQKYPGIFSMRSDNVEAGTYDTSTSTLQSTLPITCESGEYLFAPYSTENYVGMMQVGTYARYACVGGDCSTGEGMGDNRMKRYFDDIYIDNTWSRVMLCNNATYNSATICEPQIPSVWSDTSITVKGNLGALTDNTAYLFVFDADNEANATGYPVTIGANAPTIPGGVVISGGAVR